MEGKEEVNSGVTVRGDDAPESFRLAPRADIPVQSGAPPTRGPAPPLSMTTPSTELKKKRGRPRKYGPDGAVSAALSPMPISASIPLTGDFSGWKQPSVRPFQTVKKAPQLESLGDKLAHLGGANFTPHIITVNTGEIKLEMVWFHLDPLKEEYSKASCRSLDREIDDIVVILVIIPVMDIAMKVLSFSQQESRAICVLSASGSISNVTLRQPNSSGGTLTYEGRFEILSLTGSFMLTDNGIMRSRSGGMSISLAGPDGRVFGGGLAGLLVAASPVQVVLGSFLAGHQLEQKANKHRVDSVHQPVIPAVVTPVNRTVPETGCYGGQNNTNFNPPSFVLTDSMNSLNRKYDCKDGDIDNNLSSSPEGESNEDDGHSKDELSG